MGDRYDTIYAFILYSGILGVFFGLLYDVFRIIRMAFCVPGIIHAKKKGKPHKNNIAVNAVVFICDLLFFILAGCITAIFIFHVNDGKVRGIALFGSLIGFIIYYNTIGRLVTRISAFIIKGIYFLIMFTLNRILKPFMLLLIKAVQKVFASLFDLSDLLYTRRTVRKIISSAKRGFR